MSSPLFEFWKNALMNQYYTMPADALKNQFKQWLSNLPISEQQALDYYDNRLIIRMFLGDTRPPGLSSEYNESQFPEIAKTLLVPVQEWKASHKS